MHHGPAVAQLLDWPHRRCYTGRRDQVFFHASELQPGPHSGGRGSGGGDGGSGGGSDGAAASDQQGKPVLSEAIQPGAPVEFTIVEGDPQQNRRTVGVEVNLLLASTMPMHGIACDAEVASATGAARHASSLPWCTNPARSECMHSVDVVMGRYTLNPNEPQPVLAWHGERGISCTLHCWEYKGRCRARTTSTTRIGPGSAVKRCVFLTGAGAAAVHGRNAPRHSGARAARRPQAP